MPERFNAAKQLCSLTTALRQQRMPGRYGFAKSRSVGCPVVGPMQRGERKLMVGTASRGAESLVVAGETVRLHLPSRLIGNAFYGCRSALGLRNAH